MFFNRKILCLLISFLVIFNINFKAHAVDIANVSELENGKVIVKSLNTESKSQLRGAEAKILIQSPVEKVWDILSDQEHLIKINPRVKNIKILEKNDISQKTESEIEIYKFLPTLKYTLLIDQSEKYKKIKFNKIDGCFNQLYGVVELEPYQNGTILTYRMYLDLGFPISVSACDDGMKKNISEALHLLKSKAESNPKNAS